MSTHGATEPSRAPGRGGGLAAKTVLAGRFQIETPLRRTALVETYAAVDTQNNGAVAVHLVLPAIAGVPGVREAVAAAATATGQLPEHKHLARTLGAGDDGAGRLYVVTEAIEGSSLRDLLARKHQSGAGGFGARGAANITATVCGALIAAAAAAAGGELAHGAVSSDSVFISRQGKIKIVDLALGRGFAAAVAAQAVVAPSWLAPEVAKSGVPTSAGDVYGLGALLYETLVGQPLSRGGRRPSEVVEGVTAEVDEFIARCCAAHPDKRFGSPAVVKELVVELLHRAGGNEEEAAPSGAASGTPSGPVAEPSGSGVRPAAAAVAAAVAADRRPSLAASLSRPSGSGATALPAPSASDPAMSAALANTAEKWLVSKGKLDYGPFAMADIVEQIRVGTILPGHVIIDNDTGARVAVEDHPLLSRLVDEARQQRDDQRRAQAEVAHASSEKRRGLALYAFIAAGVAAVAVAAWLVIKLVGKDEQKKVASVGSIGDSELNTKISFPTTPKPAPKRPSGGGGGGARRGGGGGGENLDLDLSDDDSTGSEVLDPNTINGVVQRSGGRLGGCLRKNGGGTAAISFSIEGKSGRVNFVKVNDAQSGGLYSCVNSVMRGMQFPSVNGPRTRAEFEMSL
jgi:protein tyrosine kinase